MAFKFGYRLTKIAESDLEGIVSYITVDLYKKNESYE